MHWRPVPGTAMLPPMTPLVVPAAARGTPLAPPALSLAPPATANERTAGKGQALPSPAGGRELSKAAAGRGKKGVVVVAAAAAEKRLRRYRSRPTRKIQDRIDRAASQRLYLVHTEDGPPQHPEHGGPSCKFSVLGSTGSLYTVVLSRVPTCGCPDHLKGNLCKHILFVLTKVVGLPVDSELVYQDALLTSELESILRKMKQRRDDLLFGVAANDAVRQIYMRMRQDTDGAGGGDPRGRSGNPSRGTARYASIRWCCSLGRRLCPTRS